jgi:hypothetical protein
MGILPWPFDVKGFSLGERKIRFRISLLQHPQTIFSSSSSLSWTRSKEERTQGGVITRGGPPGGLRRAGWEEKGGSMERKQKKINEKGEGGYFL